MTAQRRKDILVAVLISLLTIAAGWSYARYDAARSGAVRAWENLAASRSLASRIDQLRHKPNLAGAQELQLAVLGRQVERAAQVAQVTASKLARIWPEPARRVGNTVYREKSTQITLKDVSTRQFVVFLHTLTATTPGLSAQSLRLSASRGRETEDSWAAEVVVTYLIYAPPKSVQEIGIERGSSR